MYSATSMQRRTMRTRARSRAPMRSEERRVGKECRSRWAPYQAEDGIRDGRVTGVQTCALPIFNRTETDGYDAFGRLTSRTDQYGNTTSVTYDRLGRMLTSSDVFGNVNATTYDAYSRTLTSTDEIGRASCRERV